MLATVPPRPEPFPQARSGLVAYVKYSFTAPAVDELTGRRLPGWQFRCVVNRNGTRSCVLVTVPATALAGG